MEEKNPIKPKRRFTGFVVSDAMDKTIVVEVVRIKRHPKYRKHFKVYKKFKVHDPKEAYAVGDRVEFFECRPISRDKRWTVVYKEIDKAT